jgi:hypothetical protein
MATKGMEQMAYKEFVHTVNMVFPYIHREQISLWNKAKQQLQNTNPFFSKDFLERLSEGRDKGIFLRVQDIVQKKLEYG